MRIHTNQDEFSERDNAHRSRPTHVNVRTSSSSISPVREEVVGAKDQHRHVQQRYMCSERLCVCVCVCVCVYRYVYVCECVLVCECVIVNAPSSVLCGIDCLLHHREMKGVGTSKTQTHMPKFVVKRFGCHNPVDQSDASCFGRENEPLQHHDLLGLSCIQPKIPRECCDFHE